MQDISGLSLAAKNEIAEYIRRDNLEYVNAHIEPAHVRDTFYTRHGKRIMDILIGALGFTVSLPFNLIIAIITYFDVGRPILFEQQRIGKDGQFFTIYKFRNMTNDIDANGELLPPSKRVTKWGKFVRMTSLDELLNFVSVLKGDMSIIGCRPLMTTISSRLNDRHKAIYSMRPGLECPTLHKVDHALSWQERLDNYVWYVENCSFWLDIRLCFRILAVAFDRKETSRRSKASHGGFLGYDLNGNVIYTKFCPDQYVEEYCRNHGFVDLNDAVTARMAEKNPSTFARDILAEKDVVADMEAEKETVGA